MVSGAFGAEATATHPAPIGTRSVFFTNHPKTAELAENSGWEPVLLDGDEFAPDPDSRASSLQSKYVKFLQFRRDFPDLARYEWVTYCDHKAMVRDQQLVWLMTNISPDAAALLRYSPKRKDIPKEIEVANGQQRYAAKMPETRAWVEAMRQSRAASLGARIANTGIIHAVDLETMQPLLDEVYDTCHQLGQPECQIIWATLAQRYDRHIHYVDWFDVDVPWAQPA